MFRPITGRLGSLVLAAIAVAACGGASTSTQSSGSLHPTSMTNVTVSYSEIIADEWAPWAAADGGIFQKNNLNVDLQYIASSTGIAALLSGQTQIAQLGGSDVLNAASGGADLVIVANMIPVFPYVFLVPNSITSADQLKGKRVGVSKIGGSADVATRAALRKLNLDPAKDVTIVETGSAANRVAALRTGAIQGGVSQPPESTTLQKQGFHVLLDMAKDKLPAANTVVAVRGDYLKAHKDVVQAFVDSLIEAQARLKKDKTFAEGVLTKWEKVTDPAVLDDAYTFYNTEVFAPYPAPQPAQYQAAIDNLKSTNAKLAGFDVSKLLNASFVKSAQDRKLAG